MGKCTPRIKPCSAIPSSPVEFLASLSLMILERLGIELSPDTMFFLHQLDNQLAAAADKDQTKPKAE